jgi:hypothetical protein
VYTLGPHESGYSRAPRIDLRTPIVFRFADGIAKGHSQNISESGLLVVFDRSLDVWLTGQLSVGFGEWHVNIEARVVRVDGPAVALTFVNISDKNRTIIRKVIEDASAGLS